MSIDGNSKELWLNQYLETIDAPEIEDGIEEDKTRLTKNKPEAGKITINASITNEELTLVVEDDGQGLNLRHLEAKGLAEKIITEDASDASIANIIFHSGISTAENVSNISGRFKSSYAPLQLTGRIKFI
jgi:hypothetical protein